MKTTNYSALLLSLFIFSCYACNTKAKQNLAPEENRIETSIAKVPLDTVSIDISASYNTPHMDDGKLEEYYAANNKYANWDRNNKRTVFIRFGCAKDGSTFDVKLMKTCGVEKLDQEAVRLIKNIVMDNPAKDALGNPLRVRNMVIPVPFPAPKKEKP